MNGKILIIASGRIKNSITYEKTMEFIHYLPPQVRTTYTIEYINIKDYKVQYCEGCFSCFINGNCPISDDTALLKQKLLHSDVILFAAPVYANNIPGDLKTFIDRISHWTHLFKLYGKLGAIIVTTSNSGVEEVGNYLAELMLNLGIYCTGIAHFNSLTPSSLSLERTAKKLSEHLEMEQTNYSLDKLNLHFKSLKTAVKKNMFTPYEKHYWESHHLLDIEEL